MGGCATNYNVGKTVPLEGQPGKFMVPDGFMELAAGENGVERKLCIEFCSKSKDPRYQVGVSFTAEMYAKVWEPRRILCRRESSNGYLSQCKGNDMHEAIEEQKEVLKDGLLDVHAFLPMTMGACGEMADWESIGGMTGRECKDFHERKVRTALEGNKRRLDSQHEFWHSAKMLPFALISSKYQSVVAWFILT